MVVRRAAASHIDRTESGATPGIDPRFVLAVEAIYDAAPEPSLWPHVLQKIAECFDDMGCVLIWRRDDGGFGTIVSPSLITAQQDYEEHGWYLRDLCAQRAVERALWLRGDAATDRDAVSDEEMETHPIYTDFFARHDLRWRAIVGVAPDPHVSVFIAIQRSGRKQPHSDAELALAARLGRHVEKSLRLSIRLLDTELANIGLGEALMRVGIGVFALDSLGRVMFRNPAGERLLGNQIEIVNGRLRMGSGEVRAAIDAAIAQSLRGEPVDILAAPNPILLRHPSSHRPLVVYLLPVRSRDSLMQQFVTRTRAIVLVIEAKAGEPADPAVVRDVLGLTLGEARVAALVASGMAPYQVSQGLGITKETVRTVLKRVYGKVGISRQSELSALLSRLAIQ